MNFSDLKELINHLKYKHFVTSSDTLQCKQNNCNQFFSTFKAFRIHILRVHKDTNQENDHFRENSNLKIQTENINKEPTALNNDSFDNNNSEISPIYNLNESLNNLREKALHFSLNFHAQDNMTRSDVLEIQKQVLCSSIADALNNFFKCNNASESIPETISSLLGLCKNPFKDISTEHSFFKNLKEIGLYQDPHYHELSNHVTEKVLNGNPTLSSKSFSCYFMPLRFQLKSFFESPGVLSLTLKNTQLLLSKNNICHFINGESFANKMKHFGDYHTCIHIF